MRLVLLGAILFGVFACAPAEEPAQISSADSTTPVLEPSWVFHDGMILQQGRELRFFGVATPGATVEVQLGEEVGETIASDDGAFEVTLPTRTLTGELDTRQFRTAEAWPTKLTFRSGGLTCSFERIWFDDLWLIVGGAVDWPRHKKPEELGQAYMQSGYRLSRVDDPWPDAKSLLSEEQASAMQISQSPTLRSDVTPFMQRPDYASLSALAHFNRGSAHVLGFALMDLSQAESTLASWIPGLLVSADPRLADLYRPNRRTPLLSQETRALLRKQLGSRMTVPEGEARTVHFTDPGFLFEQRLADLSRLPIFGIIVTPTRMPDDVALQGALQRMLMNSLRTHWDDPELPILWGVHPEGEGPSNARAAEAQRTLAREMNLARFPMDPEAEVLGRWLAETVGAPQIHRGPLVRGVVSDSQGSALNWDLDEGLTRAIETDQPERIAPERVEIAGEDLRFYPATLTAATELGPYSSPEVARPVALRHGWDSDLSASPQDAGKPPLASFRSHPVIPIKIACIGDSLTAGFGLRNPERDAYPAQLARLLGDRFYVENFGRSATTAMKGTDPKSWNPEYANTLEVRGALAFAPDVVVANLGTNDLSLWKGMGPERRSAFVEAYELLLQQFRDLPSQPQIFLWAPIAPLYPGQANYGDEREAELNAALIEMAQEIGATAIDIHATCTDHPEWFPDKLHPNVAGSRAIAAAVHEAFGETLRKKSVPKLRSLRIYAIESEAPPTPCEPNDLEDARRVILRPSVIDAERLQFGPPGEGVPALASEVGLALYEAKQRDFAILVFSGGRSGLERGLSQVRFALPHQESFLVAGLTGVGSELEAWADEHGISCIAPDSLASEAEEAAQQLLEAWK